MTQLPRDQAAPIIQKRFERDAARFDAIYDTKKSEFSGWFNKTFRKPIFERFNIVFDRIPHFNNKTVLDVGCGSGVYAVKFALNGATVKGVDFSSPMLQLAHERATSHAVTDRCQFELNDFLLMQENTQYDYAIAMGVFDYLQDPVPFLQKLKRMTKSQVFASFPGHSLVREPLRKLRYLLTSKGRVHFYKMADIKRLAEAAQFPRFEIYPMKTGSGFVLIADA